MQVVYETIKEVARVKPNKILFSIDNDEFSYMEVNEKVDEIKKYFEDKKIKNETIGILSKGVYFQFVNFIGILISGNSPIIIHPDINKKIVNELIIENRLGLLEDGEELKRGIGSIGEVGYFGVLTSGTTGIPKVLFRSEESWVKAFNYQSDIFNLEYGCKVFFHGPLSFTANLNYVLQSISLCGTIFTTTKNMIRSWVAIMQKNNVEGIFLVPSKYKMITKYISDTLVTFKSVVSAGEKLPIGTAKKLKLLFPNADIVEYYGSSETSFISINKYDTLVKNKGSVGYAFPEVLIEIEEGSIYITSPFAAKGYSCRFKINDKGYKDSADMLYLIGRDDNVVNKGGIKVNLDNIENAIKYIRCIDEHKLFVYEDDVRGQNIALAVILNDKDFKKKEIVKLLNKILNKDEIPKVIILKEMVYNDSGKIDLTSLKEMVRRE